MSTGYKKNLAHPWGQARGLQYSPLLSNVLCAPMFAEDLQHSPYLSPPVERQ